jgi:hypothetical protein
MKSRLPQLAVSFVIAIGLTAAIAFLTDDTALELANVVFAPGMLVAALVFPQGAEISLAGCGETMPMPPTNI